LSGWGTLDLRPGNFQRPKKAPRAGLNRDSKIYMKGTKRGK